MKNLPSIQSIVPNDKKYILTLDQKVIYDWLKKQGINTDDDTLNYWSRTYRAQRIKDVVNYAQSRHAKGESIRNMGGWIHKLLISKAAVVNDECQRNRDYLEIFIKEKKWIYVQVFEKYIKDSVTGDDLPLTISEGDFKRALEALYEKSNLYKDL